jgi:hypothetical protein
MYGLAGGGWRESRALAEDSSVASRIASQERQSLAVTMEPLSVHYTTCSSSCKL